MKVKWSALTVAGSSLVLVAVCSCGSQAPAAHSSGAAGSSPTLASAAPSSTAASAAIDACSLAQTQEVAAVLGATPQAPTTQGSGACSWFDPSNTKSVDITIEEGASAASIAAIKSASTGVSDVSGVGDQAVVQGTTLTFLKGSTLVAIQCPDGTPSATEETFAKTVAGRVP